MTNRLSGAGVALVTPFNEDKSIDFQGFEKLIEHVVAGGMDYVVLMGTTGESPTITGSEKIQLLEFLQDKLKSRLPIVYGLGGNNTLAMIEELESLKKYSIEAILSASPYYNKPSQEGIYRHYKALADASEFPILLYNVPHRTSSNINAETTLRLACHPNIIGTKEATTDLYQCGIIARDKPTDFLLISGDDCQTLPIIAIGGSGVISVAANAYPAWIKSLVKEGLSGNVVKAKEIHLSMLEMFLFISEEGNPASIKAALEVEGGCDRFVGLPLVEASNELIEKLKTVRQ